jgi:hypothetical protein
LRHKINLIPLSELVLRLFRFVPVTFASLIKNQTSSIKITNSGWSESPFRHLLYISASKLNMKVRWPILNVGQSKDVYVTFRFRQFALGHLCQMTFRQKNSSACCSSSIIFLRMIPVVEVEIFP